MKVFGLNPNPFLGRIGDLYNRVSTFYSHLSKKERYMISGVGAGVLFILILFIVNYAFNSIKRLEERIESCKDSAEKVRLLKQKYLEINQRLKTIEEEIKENPDFSITGFVEKISREEGLSENLDNIKEKEGATIDKFKEMVVEVKFRKIDLRQLVEFLFKLENEGKPVKVKSLKVKTRYEGKGLLDTTIEVASYRRI